MRTRRQVGKGFNAWRGKSRYSTKMCYKRDLNTELIDYLSKSFSSDQVARLNEMFEPNGVVDDALLKILQQKVLHTRRFRSFFNKCFFETSMNFEPSNTFFLSIDTVKKAWIKMKERQTKQHTSTIKEYSRYDNGTWKTYQPY